MSARAAAQLAGADLRLLKFPSGRRERYVVENVVAVGNASGFVEPLEATSLHLIIEQIYNLTWALTDSDRILTDSLRYLLNERFASTWDDVRDFLALHYKYNEHQDTPFWRHCRAESPLGSLEDMVDHYAEVGPLAVVGSSDLQRNHIRLRRLRIDAPRSESANDGQARDHTPRASALGRLPKVQRRCSVADVCR